MHDFFNAVPVIPTVLMSISCIGFVPALTLIYVSAKAPLHANCRYLLFGWVFGLCSLFSTVIAICVLNLVEADGFLATAIRKPLLRFNLYGILTSVSVFSSCFELSITLERIISSIQPQRYQSSTLATRTLVAVTIIIICLSFVEFKIQHAGYYTECGLVMQGTDLCTAIVNTIAVRYLTRRHWKLHGWLSLNARYQIKEAYEMSRAMQPVLVTVLIFKFSIIISTDIVFYIASFGNYAVGYNEAVYLLVTAIYGNCVSVMLMRTHPALRKQALKILCKSFSEKTSYTMPETETESHFEYLRSEWQV